MQLKVDEEPGGIEFSVIFTKRPTGSDEIDLPLAANGLAFTSDDTGGIVIHLGSAIGPQVGHLSAPQMYDGKKDIDGLVSSHWGAVSMKVETLAGVPNLVLSPDPKFLSDVDTTYPVTIDPTYAVDSGTVDETSDYVYTGSTSNLSSLAYMDIGTYNTSGTAGHGFFQFSSLNTDPFPSSAVILDAHVDMYQYFAYDTTPFNGCADLYSDPGSSWTSADGLDLYREDTAWSPSSLTWSSQPYPGPMLVTDWATKGNTSSPVGGGTCGPGPIDFPGLASTVQRWIANPGTNHGFELGPVCELTACAGSMSGPRSPNQSEALAGHRTLYGVGSSNPPSITVEYAMPPQIGSLQATVRGIGFDGQTYTSTTPTLDVPVTDTQDQYPATPNASFLVANSGGNVFPQSGDNANGTVGSDGNVQNTIPAGRLTSGAGYYAQANAFYTVNGTQVNGPAATYNFYTDGVPPSAPAISSTDVRMNDWTAPDNTATSTLTQAQLTLTGHDNNGVRGYYWSLDGQPSNVAYNINGDSNATGFAQLTNIASGWHTVTAYAVDIAGNIGPSSSFSFGVGAGSVGANRTWKNVLLIPAASADKTGVTYSWKVTGAPDSTYANLPVSAVTNNGAAIASWPIVPTGSGASAVWPKLVWDAATTLGSAFGGLITVRATYGSSSGSPLAVSSTVELDKSPFGDSYASTKIGPGTLAETTGDLDVSATDLSVPGYVDPLKLGRDLTTLHPGGTGSELLTAQQRDVEASATISPTDFTSGTGASLAQSGAQFFSGTHSLAISSAGSPQLNSYAAVGGDLSGGMQAGLMAGNSYTFTGHEYVPTTVPLSLATDPNNGSQGLRAVAYWTTPQGTFHQVSDAPSAQNGWSTVSLTFRLPAGTTAAAIRLYNGSPTSGAITYWDGLSLRQAQFGTTAATKVLGPGWLLDLPAASSGLAQDTVSDDTASTGQVILTDPDGEITAYASAGAPSATCSPCQYNGIAEAAYDGSSLTKDTDPTTNLPRLVLTEMDGSKTVWESQTAAATGDASWRVTATTGTGAHDQVSYLYDAAGRMTDAYSANPTPAGSSTPITCSPVSSNVTSRGLVPGCRDMVLVYSPSTTTIPTGSATGAYPGQLAEVDYYTFDPNNPTQVIKTAMASYAYDSSGHLRSEWDPRLSTPLKTAYSYTGANGSGVSTDPTARLLTVTPPGQGATTLTYTGAGQLQASSQALPAGQSATTTVAYNAPVGSTAPAAGLPEIDASTAPTWDQGGRNPADLPVTATAIFRPDHIPTLTSGVPASGDWPYATLTYVNNDGRPTNVASYGVVNGHAEWAFGFTMFDQFTGNTLATLTPSNREHAVTTGLPGADPYVDGQTSSVTRADMLATINTYAANGIDLTQTLSPIHLATTPSQGTAVVELRTETDNVYDTGSPNGVKYHLITSSKTGALLVNASLPVDQRTTTTSYDPIVSGDASGWTLREPTTVVTGDQTKVTRYDADGRIIETRMPANPSASAAASTTITEYYTADASSPDPDCRSQSAYAGWVCKTLPGVLTTSTKAAGPQPPLDVTWAKSYNQWGESTSTITYSCSSAASSSCSSAPTRTVSSTYDGSGRVTLVHTSTANEPAGQVSTGISDQAATYDANNGQQNCVATTASTCVSALNIFSSTGNATSGAVLLQIDTAGRTTATTDGRGSVTSTSFDVDGRPITVKECAGTDPSRSTCPAGAYSSETDYTYDGTAGEHRGLLTSENANLGGSNPSIFSGTYDANGSLASETYPSGPVKTFGFDSAGDVTGVGYNFNGSTGSYTSVPDAFGEASLVTSSLSSQHYGYDQDGRLTSVGDTTNATVDQYGNTTVGTATTGRTYTYNANSDRLTAALSATYHQTIVSDSPAAYWRLDEVSGSTANDSSGNSHTGTYTSTGLSRGVTGATPGDGNTATTFSGGHVSAAAGSWNEQTGSFTDEVWLTPPTNASSHPAIMGQGHDSTNVNGWELDYMPGGGVCLTANAGNYYACASSAALATNGWHLLDVSFDAITQTLRVFVDGTQISSGASNFTNTNTSGAFNLGSSGGNGSATVAYQGGLDDAALYTKALTAAQIQTHFQTAELGTIIQGTSSAPRQYDEADRLVDAGYSYDAFGRTLTVPSADANNAGNISLGYFANDLVAKEATGTGASQQTDSYTLDPLYRVDSTTTATGGTTTDTTFQHYAGDDAGGNESASWISTASGGTTGWTRNVAGLDGTLVATLTNTGIATESFTNAQGDIVGTAPAVAGSWYSLIPESLEFGQPRPGQGSPGQPVASNGQGPDNYAWLGGYSRNQNSLAGLSLMGERLYDPSIGRFLQTDPIPGGSCNKYDYICQNPISGTDLNGQCWAGFGFACKVLHFGEKHINIIMVGACALMSPLACLGGSTLLALIQNYHGGTDFDLKQFAVDSGWNALGAIIGAHMNGETFNLSNWLESPIAKAGAHAANAGSIDKFTTGVNIAGSAAVGVWTYAGDEETSPKGSSSCGSYGCGH